jgi:RNA polymerase sigma factor (sigma-70 family)
MVSEEKIIADCRKGKRYAQELLYDRYSSSMLGVCLRYTKNRAEAEDVLQEAFIKVFKNITKFTSKENGSLTRWIKTIMINTSLNYLRDNLKYKYTDIDNVNEEYISEETEEEPVDDKLSINPEEVMKMVQLLPPGYKVVFNLYVFEKYSHKEIAENLEITESTSKSQLSKARLFLRKKLIEHKKKYLIAI